MQNRKRKLSLLSRKELEGRGDVNDPYTNRAKRTWGSA